MSFSSKPHNHAWFPTDAKWAFTTRRVNRADVAGISDRFSSATSGDLVLAKISTIGHHKRIQLAEGRNSEAYVDDFVVLCCGDRYAPDQFEGVGSLCNSGCDLLAAGGLVGRMRKSNLRMGEPTRLRPFGLLTDRNGQVINIARYALSVEQPVTNVPVIGVVGASMNSGKTTAVASLAHGLRNAGVNVATIKATGTGAFGDYNAYCDAGAHSVSDFIDAGMASTYQMPISRIDNGFDTLLAHAVSAGAEVVIVELADGIFQQETAAILKSSRIRQRFDAVMFTAADAAGAVAGATVLRELDIEPIAISGKVSCSPLATDEAYATTGIAILRREALMETAIVAGLLQRTLRQASQKRRAIQGGSLHDGVASNPQLSIAA